MKFIQRRLEPLYEERKDLIDRTSAAKVRLGFLQSSARRSSGEDKERFTEAVERTRQVIALLNAKRTKLEIRITLWEFFVRNFSFA